MEFILNDTLVSTNKPGGMTLLDFVRYERQLVGTKIGCREGDCGSCTVLVGSLDKGEVDYRSVTSCLTPLANVEGKHVVTIEGINSKELTPVQNAFVEAGGTQCGFCTVGFVVSLTGYCLSASQPSPSEAIGSMDGNICRCTGYKSIERATHALVHSLEHQDAGARLKWLVSQGFVPKYFLGIRERMKVMSVGKILADRGMVVGGGTDLYVQRAEELIHHDLSTVIHDSDTRGININQKQCVVGAMTTVSEMLRSDQFRALFPALQKYFKLISSTQIRNMGTVGGNLVNASPIGDLTVFFLALNSSVTLADPSGKQRSLLLKDFYKQYKTLDKSEHEVLTTISFGIPAKETRFNFEKVSKRTHLDIATVNTAIQLTMNGKRIEECHLSAGGISPIPLYLVKTSEYLRGKDLSPETVRGVAATALKEISPISDVRGSREYKSMLLRQLIFAHFIGLFPEQFELGKLV